MPDLRRVLATRDKLGKSYCLANFAYLMQKSCINLLWQAPFTIESGFKLTCQVEGGLPLKLIFLKGSNSIYKCIVKLIDKLRLFRC